MYVFVETLWVVGIGEGFISNREGDLGTNDVVFAIQDKIV